MTNNTFPADQPQFNQPQFNQPPAGNSMPDAGVQGGVPTQATGAQGTALSDAEKDTVRQGIFGALAYVSQADPGFFATFSESAAGAKVLGAAPAEVKDILSGGLVLPQAKSAEEFKASALPNLHQAIQIVQAKNPQAAASLKQVVLQAVQAVAQASKGVSDTEQQAIAGIQQALA